MEFKFDFDKLKNNLILGIKDSFKDIQEENKNIYCYSLIIDSDISCIGIAANTVEYFEDNIDEEDERMYYKFCEQDWKIYNDTNEHLDEAQEQIKNFVDENDNLIADKDTCYYTEFFEEFRQKVFDICIEALYEVKCSNFFDGFLKEGRFINFMIPEYLGQEESIKIFSRLNSGDIAKEYIDNVDEFI